MRSSSSARTARCRARPLRPYASAQAPGVALNPQPELDPDASPHPSPRQALHDRYNGTQERYDELHRKQVADSAELQALRERGSFAEVAPRLSHPDPSPSCNPDPSPSSNPGPSSTPSPWLQPEP